MIFAIWAPDKPGALEKRMEVRPRHLDHWGNCGLRLILVGPMLVEATGDLRGSLIIVEADDIAAVRARADADPYLLEGVFESVDIRPVKFPLGELAEHI